MKKTKYESHIFSKLLFFAFLMFFAAFSMKNQARAESAAKLNLKAINYENSTITLHSDKGDKFVYFHKKGSSAWETAYESFDSNGDLTMDISWISPTTVYQLQFKGDVSTEVRTVAIPKQYSRLKVTYNASLEHPITVSNTNEQEVEWRKNTYLPWSDWNESITSDDLNYLITNGATLYFRVKSEAGTSVDNPGKRSGKIVSLKISAKKAAPDVKYDDSAFTVNLASGMMYRKAVLNDGEVDEVATKGQQWTTVTATKEYSLSEICPEVLYSETKTLATQKCGVQFKTGSKGSTQESRVRTLLIPAQEKLISETAGASITYTSTKSLNLAVAAATGSKPYQYCIVNKDEYNNGELDYSELKWMDVKVATPISISKTQAPKGSHIFVRKKAYSTIGSEDYAIASSAIEVTSVSGVDYPDSITLGTAQTYYMPAGLINTSDYGTNITFTTACYASTIVNSIVFCNSNGGDIGSVKFTSSVAANKDSKSSADKYIITTKITDTSDLEAKLESLNKTSQSNYYGEKLYAKITLANDPSNPIMSTESNGVILVLSPRSKVVIPSSSSENLFDIYQKHYMNDFTRLYMCTAKTQSAMATNVEDDYFKFVLEMGEKNTRDRSSGAVGSSLCISSISYDDCYLYRSGDANLGSNLSASEIGSNIYKDASLGNDIYNRIFTVCYQTYIDEYGNADARRAFVTVNAKKFEEVLKAQKGENLVKTNTAKNLIITLNNGEILSSDISITLRATATIEGGTVSYANTVGLLDEPYYEYTYDANGKETSKKLVTPVEYKFSLNLFDSSYTKAEVTDIQWNGVSILGKMSRSGTKISIELSNSKINKLTTDGKASKTMNMRIIFSNGFEINSGCQLTLLDK